jgi:Alkylmercury lyase
VSLRVASSLAQCTSTLSYGEQRAYRALLERFASGGLPSAADVDVIAAAAGVDPSSLRVTLARYDLVHFGADGAPLVAYPFSATARGHRVRIDGRFVVEAMCAIDALGIATMLDLPTEISSSDPLTRKSVTIQIDPSGQTTWQPQAAVMLSTRACCAGPSYMACCTLLNFFESPATAKAYLDTHSEMNGQPITILQRRRKDARFSATYSPRSLADETLAKRREGGERVPPFPPQTEGSPDGANRRSAAKRQSSFVGHVHGDPTRLTRRSKVFGGGRASHKIQERLSSSRRRLDEGRARTPLIGSAAS